MADSRVQSMIEAIQFLDSHVDITAIMRSSHGEYRYGLHVVVESDASYHEIRTDVLNSFRKAILETCTKQNWRLARIGILSNHLHVLVGPGIDGLHLHAELGVAVVDVVSVVGLILVAKHCSRRSK